MMKIQPGEFESLSVIDPSLLVRRSRKNRNCKLTEYTISTPLHSLEGVDVKSMFETRVHVLKTVPGCMRGVVRTGT